MPSVHFSDDGEWWWGGQKWQPTYSKDRQRLVEPIWRSMCEFALGAAIGLLNHDHTVALEHEVGATTVLVIVIVDQESRVHTKLPADAQLQ